MDTAINECLKIASFNDGVVFGDYALNVIVPRFDNPSYQGSFETVDLWFKTEQTMNNFIIKMTSLTTARLSTNTCSINLVTTQYQLLCHDCVSITVNITCSEELPMRDLNVNSVTFKWDDRHKKYIALDEHFRSCTISNRTFDKYTDLSMYNSIMTKHAIMCKEFALKLIESEADTHINHINKFLQKGWSILLWNESDVWIERSSGELLTKGCISTHLQPHVHKWKLTKDLNKQATRKNDVIQVKDIGPDNLINQINGLVKVASSCDGSVFGEFVVEYLVPKMGGKNYKETFNTIDVWFSKEQDMDNFLRKIGKTLYWVGAEKSGPVVTRRYIFHFKGLDEMTTSVNLDKFGPVIKVSLSDGYPTRDLDVNSTMFRWSRDSNSYYCLDQNFTMYSYCGNQNKYALMSPKDRILNKSAIMFKEYALKLIGCDSDFHMKHINDTYLSKGWNICLWSDRDLLIEKRSVDNLLTKEWIRSNLYPHVHEWALDNRLIPENVSSTSESVPKDSKIDTKTNVSDLMPLFSLTKEIMQARKDCSGPLLQYISYLEAKSSILEMTLINSQK